MLQTIFRRILWTLLLVFLQIVVFNHVHLWGYATPMPYVYALLILPAVTPRWLYVALGFLLGLTADMGANTVGIAAAAGTATGLAVPFLLHLFAPKEYDEDTTLLPSVHSMGWTSFMSYAAFAVILHVGLFHVIEDFAFYFPLQLLLNIVGSALFTMVFIVLFEVLQQKK
ncbi:MAG: rod shape-determining protein MreD [Alloprevotella sp.]|nr:rod shape-determining protein MreD [Alloprevotella sp.]